ncbi:hypothetical protein SCLCIDRAFT_30951 [Scleroderma citrinum Foug A]|uniref:Uncharacterized protein n=1 Tax=Scleroderma citrinum Foug A TaxID=1036808 RepID=A0A0C2YYI7_9AGAM|nr:hypothetical protein SCLCIDRAFT_30951 [Scleroderma citrinum Foug A]
MSVLHSTGLETTFAGLTQIRNDCLNAERQINERLHRKHLVTLTEGTLETGIDFSAMEDDVDADLMDYGGIVQAPSPTESNWDSDDTGDERDPQPEGQPEATQGQRTKNQHTHEL